MLVLMFGDAPVMPGDLANGKFLSDLVDEVMMGLFWGIVGVGEDRCKARFAVSA
jgi:hypothetical protein